MKSVAFLYYFGRNKLGEYKRAVNNKEIKRAILKNQNGSLKRY